jgi:uncharacterized protein YkwD
VHHAPASPPRSARVISAMTRWAQSGRRAIRPRSGRLALSVAATAVLTALVLAVPVVGGSAFSPAVVDRDARLVSPGEDAGLSAARSPEPSTTGSVPGGTDLPVPDPLPPVPDPAPSTPVAPELVEVPATTPAPAPAPAPEAAVVPEATAAAPAPAVAAAAPAADDPAAHVLALVNAERAAAGCGPLSADGRLAGVARAHSEDMRDRGFFDHVNLDGLDPFDRADRAGARALAENIAQGQRDAADVMTSWMNSPGHRANILDCRLTRLGVGVAQGGGGPWWTQLFG